MFDGVGSLGGEFNWWSGRKRIGGKLDGELVSVVGKMWFGGIGVY